MTLTVRWKSTFLGSKNGITSTSEDTVGLVSRGLSYKQTTQRKESKSFSIATAGTIPYSKFKFVLLVVTEAFVGTFGN